MWAGSAELAVINFFGVPANAPVALGGYLDSSGALAGLTLYNRVHDRQVLTAIR